MRLRAILFAIATVAGAGTGAFYTARAATAWVERTTAARVGAGLEAAGEDWAGVTVDGLRITLTGAAPDETSRFRALQIVRQIAGNERVGDASTLQAAALSAPPAFALDILRNGAEVSLIGLVPDRAGRNMIRAALRTGDLANGTTDMLEEASDPAPPGWTEALDFGLAIAAVVPRAKVSVVPGRVTLLAVTDNEADRVALEARLRRDAPAGVALDLDVSAPRPVIAPFVLAASLDPNGTGRLETCSAETPEDATAIEAAARAAGLAVAAPCAIGLGAPSPAWAPAAMAGIAALPALGGGRFALRDRAAELAPPADTPAGQAADVARTLAKALPEPFALTTIAPPPPVAAVPEAPAIPRFDALLQPDGTLRLAGPLRDAAAQAAVRGVAAAYFSHDQVIDSTTLDPTLPANWPVRVLAGIEALAGVKRGRLEVTPTRVAIYGTALDAGADGRLESLLAEKLGHDAEMTVEVGFDQAAAAAAAEAARPRPEVCADEIDAILESGSITFAAGSAEIAPESAGVIAAIADVLRSCPGARFEIGGHTDSAGPADVNTALSQDRAEAVVAALEDADLPTITFVARGYGASRPVADNGTEEGRARNRRIEFSILADTPPTSPAARESPSPETTVVADETCAAEINTILTESPLVFDPGSARLSAESAPILGRVAASLARCPDAQIAVTGYTDAEGSEAHNQALSQDRAEAVVTALREGDLPLAGLTAVGRGEADPVADNATAEGRAQNRRIAFIATATDAGEETNGDDGPQ